MLDSLALSNAEKKAVEELLLTIRAQWPSADVRIFGSKATGTADEESDLDVLVLLPCPVTEAIRKKIIHDVFEINLSNGSNISAIAFSKEEWEGFPLSVLPFHANVEEEGIIL